MTRDFKKYNQARKLRQDGKSIRTISKLLKISSSSASIWCRDIKLSDDQRTKLAKKGQNVILLRKFAKERHERKLNNDKNTYSQAKKEIQKLSKNELFLIGLALYWAEGFKSKKEKQVGFCNSDPRMIKFMLNWFKDSIKISNQDFLLRAEFNITHKSRKEEIEDYWSKLTGITRVQFHKPYLQKAKQIRDYSNKGEYFGLLRIRIRRSSVLLVKLRGWIEGLSLK